MPGRSPVIVLGYDLWQRRFAGDRGVIGAGVRVNGDVFTVIGVMGRDFHFVRHTSLGAPENADAYITFAVQPRDHESGATVRSRRLIRARAGASATQVAAAVAAVGKSLDERYFKNRGVKLYPVGLQAGSRRRRSAGARRARRCPACSSCSCWPRILRRCCSRARCSASASSPSHAHSARIRGAGSRDALEADSSARSAEPARSLAAVWGTRTLVALAPLDLPRRESIAVDWRVAAMVIGVGALLGVVAGAAPAFWASRSTLATLLRNAAVRGGGQDACVERSSSYRSRCVSCC